MKTYTLIIPILLALMLVAGTATAAELGKMEVRVEVGNGDMLNEHAADIAKERSHGKQGAKMSADKAQAGKVDLFDTTPKK